MKSLILLSLSFPLILSFWSSTRSSRVSFEERSVYQQFFEGPEGESETFARSNSLLELSIPTTQERMALFFQPGQKADYSKLIREIRRYARQRNITFVAEELDRIPEEITATPALVYQNESGRTIYPGIHLDAEAMKLFVDGNRIALRPIELDFRRSVAVQSTGRATTILVLKVTDWSVEQPSISVPDSAQWQQEVLVAINRQSDFDQYGSANLWPTDRRYYVDIHAYRSASGQDYLTSAVFSQFNCHEPIFTSFGQPVSDLETLVDQMSNRLKPFYTSPERGFSPDPVIDKDFISWEELGWSDAVTELVQITETKAPNSQPGQAWIASAGQLKPRSRVADLPMVQFNFPPPIDRYAGTIEKLDGEIEWSADGQSLSGEFEVDMSKLTMGNEALDEYVLKDALRTRRFKYARFRFADVQLPADWQTGQLYQIEIPAQLELMGVTVPIPTQADLKATYDAAGNPILEVNTLMELDIKRPFGLIGPDGPDNIKNTVRIRTQFQLSR